MARNSTKKPRKRQEYIDAGNFAESRKTWNPDPAKLERDLERINRRHARQLARRKAG